MRATIGRCFSSSDVPIHTGGRVRYKIHVSTAQLDCMRSVNESKAIPMKVSRTMRFFFLS